jgi:hypothetical protein
MRLAQTALSATVAAVYTTPANCRAQITEIWLANNNTTTARRVTLRAHGTAATNNILTSLEIAANGTQIIDSAKIILTAGQVLAALQDVGTDVILTAYGVEEVV